MELRASACAGIDLRSEQESDQAFLQQLYASTRADELALLDHWTELQKSQFLQSQYEAQHQHYRQHYPDARYDVLLKSGQPIGRLYVAVLPGELRLMDIALMPAWRNQGIGGALVKQLMSEAESAQSIMSLHVEENNPARRLYQRLGFDDAGTASFYLLMQWTPEQVQAIAE